MSRPADCDIDAVFAATVRWTAARLAEDLAAGVTLTDLRTAASAALAPGRVDRLAYNRACLRFRAMERHLKR